MWAETGIGVKESFKNARDVGRWPGGPFALRGTQEAECSASRTGEGKPDARAPKGQRSESEFAGDELVTTVRTLEH
jgi:hypothetical protein